MARRYRLYKEGTPERALQDAVIALHPNRQETFFEGVAKRLGIRTDSASGTFYRVLRNGGSLPLHHRDAYIKAGIAPDVLDELAPPQIAHPSRTRLQELEAGNEERRQETRALERLVRELTERVTRLEARESKGRVTG